MNKYRNSHWSEMRFGKIAIQNTIVQNELIDWLIDKPIDLNITHQLKYNYMHKIWRSDVFIAACLVHVPRSGRKAGRLMTYFLPKSWDTDGSLIRCWSFKSKTCKTLNIFYRPPPTHTPRFTEFHFYRRES